MEQHRPPLSGLPPHHGAIFGRRNRYFQGSMPYGRRFLHHRSIQDAHLPCGVSKIFFGFTSLHKETCPVNRFSGFFYSYFTISFRSRFMIRFSEGGNVGLVKFPKRSATLLLCFSRFLPVSDAESQTDDHLFPLCRFADGFSKSAISTSSSRRLEITSSSVPGSIRKQQLISIPVTFGGSSVETSIFVLLFSSSRYIRISFSIHRDA